MSHGPRIGRSQSPCCSLAGYGVVAFCSTRFGTFSTAPTHTMHKPHRADRHRRTLLRRSTAVGCCPIASPSLPSLSAHLSPPSSKSLFFLSLSLSPHCQSLHTPFFFFLGIIPPHSLLTSHSTVSSALTLLWGSRLSLI